MMLDRDAVEKIRAALDAAKDLSKTMEGLTACRSDDDYVWGAQEKIDLALEALSAREATEGGEAVARVAFDLSRSLDIISSAHHKAGRNLYNVIDWRGEHRGQIALTPEERDALNPILPHPSPMFPPQPSKEGEPIAQVEAAGDIGWQIANECWLDTAEKAKLARRINAAIRSASIPPSGVAAARAEALEDAARPDPRVLYANAVAAMRALDDYTHTNETEFTGWGDGIVPPGATWWRIKSGQALKALDELRALSKEAE